MTEPEDPPAAPSGGATSEQISARLEALLKRTHALRAQQGTDSAVGPLGVAWPPPDRELDRYDVVDVDVAPAAALPGRPARPDAAAAPDFARPDWSELRLRSPIDGSPSRLRWPGVLFGLVALAAIAEGAYIWYLHSTRPPMAQGRLLVDEPKGAEVRVDGSRVGVAPLEHILDPGQYDIELVDAGRVVRANRVIVGLGRTVMLLAPDGPARSALEPTPSVGTAPTSRPVPAPTARDAASAAAVAASGALVSATTGAVSIESTPSGLAVTMGGRPRGVTPITLGQLPPGRHDVLVGSAARRVDVLAGQVATLRVGR